MSSARVDHQISLFRSQVELRRFDDGTLRILESLLVSKDVKSLLEVRSSLSDFIRRESLSVIREIADKSVEHKLSVVEFFVRAFALAGDIESCLALRYEALALRELRSPSNQWLRVSYEEWMTFAEHSLDNGFYSIATKACESALSCFEMNGVNDPQHDDFFRNIEVTGKIKRLKDAAVASLASRSVRAQAADYLKKKLVEMNPSPSLALKEKQFSASTLFRDGIKKHNARKLLDHRRINHITSEPDSNL
ncbi:protein DOUBLE-STRAND BREAK FORMATION [Rhododendron vialii]|uniref:protein DOUBLE-STRAND BREAK FORMATION n=1 Tax=Rhododendron vialii TaxID=182163 RepID=UPI00265EC730|nr:protein DOUBLE-STRAND BREAK FORMATION [Rhododendron vialii]